MENQKVFDYLVFIGRFQPFHYAHKEVVDIAFRMSNQVILVLGSAQDERTIKNPFSVEERQLMIRDAYSEDQAKRLHFVRIIDLYNDVKWTAAVKSGVNSITTPDAKIGLIGHFKDESSYYLRLFPEWELVELENLKNEMSATPLRNKYYVGEIQKDSFPPNVEKFLIQFQHNPIYPVLQDYFKRNDTSILQIEKKEA